MGIVKVCASYKDDPTDNSGKFGMVDVEYVETLKTPVTLEQIKQRKELQDLALIKQSRLSVMPIMLEEWECILKLAINNISLAT